MSLSCIDHAVSSYIEPLLSSIDDNYKNSEGKLVVYLEAGHFNTGFGVDDFCLNSLKDAVHIGSILIKKYNKNIKLVYGILADDLGLSCADEQCTITPVISQQSVASLPEELEAFIGASKLIKRDKLMIFSERTSKNRAIDTIKKSIKNGCDGLILTENGNYDEIKVRAPDDSEFLLAKRQGSTFIAKCPAIISQHYKDVLLKLRQRFFECDHFLIVDWSDLADRNKISQGKIALQVLQGGLSREKVTVDITNVFFGDDEGEICRIDGQKGPLL